MQISNTLDTQTIEIELTDELRSLLKDQEKIREEMKFNVTELPYLEFVSYVNGQQLPEPSTCITLLLFEQLFEQYPELARIKEKIVISTFRTSFTSDSGLNGETNMHMDNMLFPGDKDRNLLVTWGLGTEASTIKNSIFIEALRNKILDLYYTDGLDLFDNFSDFNKSFFDHPDKSIDELFAIDTYDESFKKIVKGLVETYPLDEPRILKSVAPNKNDNITALIISGKEVYHRRETIVGQAPSYRYALNIYFDSKEILVMGGRKNGGRKNGRKSKKSATKKNKKKTNRKRSSY